MPPYNGQAVGMPQSHKRSTEDVASGFVNGALILIVLFFVLGSLWVEVFAIPAFFIFFRSSIVTIASVRQVSLKMRTAVACFRWRS